MVFDKSKLNCDKKKDEDGNEKLVCNVGDGAVVAKRNMSNDGKKYSYLPRKVTEDQYKKTKAVMKKMLGDTEGLTGEH